MAIASLHIIYFNSVLTLQIIELLGNKTALGDSPVPIRRLDALDLRK
jgi:hypothetical protein